MPIVGFRNNNSPEYMSLNSAYRPIIFQPQFNTILAPYPPVVYCDVFFNNSYYGTLTSTSFLKSGLMSAPYWEFDIQNMSQEYLKSILPNMISTTVSVTVNDALGVNGASVNCYCRFRVGVVDGNGFLIPESSPGNGGFMSSNFIIINAVLQHEDLQRLDNHLFQFRLTPYNDDPYQILPLSHRSDGMIVCKNDYDHFQVFVKFSGLLSPTIENYAIKMKYWKAGDNLPTEVFTAFDYTMLSNRVHSIPIGIIQLRQIDWFLYNGGLMTPTIVSFDDIQTYELALNYNMGVGSTVTAFTLPRMVTSGCGCCKGRMRIRFLNYLGGFDAANFSEINGSLITTSDQWQKALKAPLNKSDGGFKKLNVRSNESFVISTCGYGEESQEWLKELFSTPEAYLEWPGTQGQLPTNIPVVIKDGEFTVRKIEGRYEYITEITIQMANENIHQRN